MKQRAVVMEVSEVFVSLHFNCSFSLYLHHIYNKCGVFVVVVLPHHFIISNHLQIVFPKLCFCDVWVTVVCTDGVFSVVQ